MTKEQLSILKEQETNLRRAYEAHYVIGVSRKDSDAVYKVAKELGIKTGCTTCPTEIMNVYNRVGKIYFETVNKNNKKKK